MPNFTRIAIKNAFVKLLALKPLNKISVKDIVEECGINRNSFYYHFQDVPALLESIVMEEMDKIIADYSPRDPIEKCLKAAMSYAEENRNMALHVYRYMDRELFEGYLWRVCEHIVSAYTDNEFQKLDVSEQDRSMINYLYKCECFGIAVDWLNNGMQSTGQEEVERVCSFISDSFTDFERRSKYGSR